MYVDGGSSTEVLYEHCFNLLRPEIKNQMVPATTSLTGFSGETIWPLGQVRLLVTIGDADHSTRAWMNFMIVRSLSPYNGIIKRPRIREIQKVPSTAHGMLKFLVDGGIVTIRSTILIPAECATVITSSREITKEAGFRHENFKVAPHPNFPDQEVAIRGTLSAKGQTELCSLLKENLDIFAWQPSDMTGNKRGQAPERAKAIQTEVQKLVESDIMREVYYHEWLSNPVMVKKHDGSWQMCVNFTDLNKACPQDCYPLPEIDWKVESLCGYPFKCFLDAYKGYHKIRMAESDEEKTAFHTSQGVYCYTKMPFGLKNAGATYQRLVDKAFDSQVGRNIEVYVDDLVIKSHTETEMLRDIDETFRTLRKINMKLNPKKCTFEAVEGMFLGYMISPERIRPCPDKTEAVLQLPSPRTIKEKCIKKSDFHWTPEAEQAFKQLKQNLLELPLLVAPKPKEELIVYLSTTHGAISAVLMTEKGHGSDAGLLQVVEIIADFHVEKPDESPSDTSVVETPQEPWTLFTDGSSCVDGSGAGLILTSPEGTEFTYALRFQFSASNNEADYKALIASLRITVQMGLRNVHVRVDSKLVANQVLRAYVAKEENMIKYLEKVKILVSGFASFSISQVPRSQNKKADALSKIASTSFAHLSKQVLVEILKEKSIQEEEVTIVVEEDGRTWMTPIIEYLKEGTLPDDKMEASKLRIKARQYEFLEGYSRMTVIRGSQSHAAGILLANHAPRRTGNDTHMQQLSNTSSRAKKPPTATNPNHGPVAAHRTMIKSSHGDTPFSLTYGMEAVIPAEIGMLTYRTMVVDAVHNDEELRLNLDLLEERRERAVIREAKTKLKMAKYYNARVRGVTFRLGDFVYRSNDASHAVGRGKLGPKWEGPYEVTKALGDGAYKLRSTDETRQSKKVLPLSHDSCMDEFTLQLGLIIK
ncbi:reverse transcriptase domain-containing protein [Tanacetum coccineum]